MNLWLVEHFFFQISTLIWEKKCSISQRFICTEVTSYKNHILVVSWNSETSNFFQLLLIWFLDFKQNFMMKRQGDLFDNNIFSNFQTPKHSKVLQDFYIKLQDSGKAKLLALVRTSLRDPKLDCVRLLAELSNEQNFDVTYVDIEERNANGEVQCLVCIFVVHIYFFIQSIFADLFKDSNKEMH